MSLAGVERILEDCEKSVTHEEVFENIDDDIHLPQETGETGLEEIVQSLSVEVAVDTDTTYKRYLEIFEKWLQDRQYIPAGTSITQEPLPAETPLYIVAWVMSQCDSINPDGSVKSQTEIPHSYTHAQKLRAALTYGFGRNYARGKSEWNYSHSTQRWEGNPSVSLQVGRYMVSLRKRKYRAGDRQAMSSKAITSETIRQIYRYNNSNDRTKVIDSPTQSSRATDDWASPRKRLLVHSVMTIAYTCLLRLDEALSLQFSDVSETEGNSNCIKITLDSRKTHQFGGSKPYVLWAFPEEDRPLCPVTALAKWVVASGLKSGYIFRPPVGDRAPAELSDTPISSAAFLELFRNNLVDIGICSTPYGGHSFRRGGCQWLVRERRWNVLQVCDWGGWSRDFTHSSILRYLFSRNDDPYDSREDYFNPNRESRHYCTVCRRGCWCS